MLVGPLLSISPFIPATITFILLSLVTVDTLAWGNQGTNLFLNLFLSEEQKQRIIHHEAGHFFNSLFIRNSYYWLYFNSLGKYEN